MSDKHNTNNSIFHTGENEVNHMRENLEKLYNLTDEEKSEESLLQARIEEQSHLIMMLKKRADEYLLRCQVLDKENKDLETQLTIAVDKNKTDDKKSRIIYGNFTKLTQAQNEMKIEFENVKQLNEQLKHQSNQLKSEIVSLTGQLQNQSLTEKINEDLNNLTCRNNQLELEIKTLKENHSKELVQKQQECKKQQEIIDFLNADLKKIEKDFRDFVHKSELSTEKLKNENIMSVNELKNMKKNFDSQATIMKKNNEEITELTKKSKTYENLYKDLKEKYQRESENFNVNAQIQKLKTDLQMEEVKFRELRQDYEAYKVYSNKVLQTEKELSSRLRKLYS